MIQILGLATAEPPLRLTQKEALRFITQNIKMRAGTRALYEKVLSDPSIRKRHFALKNLKDVLEENPDVINRRFEKESVKLSSQALIKALKKSGVRAKDVDFLAVSTCTGYLCPGISTRMIETCGLRPDVHCVDIVGMGCGSAIPALEAAHNFISAHPKAVAVALSTEICSAAMFADDFADLVVSNAIFADGSAAAVLSNSNSKGKARILRFESSTHPELRETLRFRTERGRLRNVLHKDIPVHAARILKSLITKSLDSADKSPNNIRHWVFHSGGKKVLDAIQEALQLSDGQMKVSRHVLKNFGNLSSPTVLYGLDQVLNARIRPKGAALLSSFGAGFSAFTCLLELN